MITEMSLTTYGSYFGSNNYPIANIRTGKHIGLTGITCDEIHEITGYDVVELYSDNHLYIDMIIFCYYMKESTNVGD